MDYNKEVSVSDFRNMVLRGARFLKKNILVLFIGGFLFACLGILYAWLMKPSYTAEMTFAAESDKQGMNAYSGIAAQFGFDLSSGGGSVFEGENLMHFFKSRMLVERALLTPVEFDGQTKPLIYRYISTNKMDEKWAETPLMKGVFFTAGQPDGNRARDSVLNSIVKDVSAKLVVDKVDKKNNITAVRFSGSDEFFAKTFVEQLVSNALNFYMDYKSKKSRQNVQILQKQADSVKALLTGGIYEIASTNDLNLNPLRQITRAPIQRKQVDVQVNGKLYEEILKQLELAKITMRRETPLVQVIDVPRYPLEKKKMGRLKGAFIFGFVGVVLTLVFLVVKRIFRG